MAQDTRTRNKQALPKRKARGFLQAGGLIGQQMRTAQARRGFAQARLQSLWPDIVGADLAALCAPLKLTPTRGPAGGLLKLAVSGPHAPQIQMMVPTISDRINAALGPGTVGRIQLVQAALPVVQRGNGHGGAATRTRPAGPIPEPMQENLSSIGDLELRDALQTLAENVLSRSRRSRTPED